MVQRAMRGSHDRFRLLVAHLTIWVSLKDYATQEKYRNYISDRVCGRPIGHAIVADEEG